MSDIKDGEKTTKPELEYSSHRVISAGDRKRFGDFEEIWRFRHLLFTLVKRNVSVRYKNTAMGMFWIVLQPGLQMGVYTLIFGIWARLPTEGVPYAVFVLSGLVQVAFINGIINGSAGAVRSNQGVSKKVYFPKSILPFVVILTSLVDYGVQLVLLVAVMAINGVAPTANIIYLPFIFLSLLMMLVGLSLWFTALGVRYRDVTLALPAVSMLITFLSPVIYPITLVPAHLHAIYATVNPFVGYVTALKWSIVGVEPFYPWMLGISSLYAVFFLITGFLFFVRTERDFNDYL